MLKLDLSGRVAVVTGASGELGRAIARTLAEAGADVAIHYHGNKAMAETLLGEVRAMGRRGMIARAAVSDRASVEAMRDAVAAELGDADIVVNNAVSQYKWTAVLEQDPADYEDQFRSCVMQNVLMAKAFAPAMMKRGWGRIIAINTECAMQNTAGQSAYVSGKRGMDGVLRVLAREIGGAGVTVNQVAPGWMVSENRPEEGRPSGYVDAVPLRRWGHDRDVANAVAFLASDLAGFITGVYLPVCGGNVMPCI